MQVCMNELMDRTGVRFGTSGARGLVVAMTDEVCYAYAAAFVACLGSAKSTVLLGHDLRPSSPRMAAACAQACRDAGWKVVYAGALPTPALAYAGIQRGWPVVVVTGSHIPFDRNGIKFYRADGEISKADEQAIAAGTVQVPQALTCDALPEVDISVRQMYVDRYVSFFGPGALLGKRVAVYEHSSVARDVLGDVLRALGAQVQSLGRTDIFVPIDTEAVRPEDVVQARKWAAEHGFDALFSTDGDADRPLIGDERGEWLRGDVVGILTAQYLRADAVVAPVSCNTALEKCGSFGQVQRTRIGSPYVIAGMQEASAAGAKVTVGYEANGGFLLGSDVLRGDRKLAALPTRDALLPMLALLMLSSERGCKLSDLSIELPARFTASDRIVNFAPERSAVLLRELRTDALRASAVMAPDSGAIVAVSEIDGLRITFTNGEIVHLRPSGNAPELRCYAEADTPERATELCMNCLSRLAEQA